MNHQMENQSAIIKNGSSEVENSIYNFAASTTAQWLRLARDIRRKKIAAVTDFFVFCQKHPEEITAADIHAWHQQLLDKDYADSTIYTKIAHLSAYFDWLLKLPGFLTYLKVNPVSTARPRPPKKYNSDQSKSLTDEQLSRLWKFIEEKALPQATDDIQDAETQDMGNVRATAAASPEKPLTAKAKARNAAVAQKAEAERRRNRLGAIRDYAIISLFCSTGMRREEILGLRAKDVRFSNETLIIDALVKGGMYQSRTISVKSAIEALKRYLIETKRTLTVADDGNPQTLRIKDQDVDYALWCRFDRGKDFAEIEAKNKAREEAVKYIEPQLSSYAFDKRMKKYAAEAGIGHFHLHQFRHTFARVVAEETGSLIAAQHALGHKNLATTESYIRRIGQKKDEFGDFMRKRAAAVRDTPDDE